MGTANASHAVHPASVATHEAQSADTLMLVRPASFGFNPHTAASNAFQQPSAEAATADVARRARSEFASLVSALQAHGVRCCVVDDEAPPVRPDAVFPNNWCSWHADGTLVLYPMLAASRRSERREAVIAAVCDATGFRIRRRLDFTPHENEQRFLEGTGSLVLDRAHRVAYACRSPRTDDALVAEWCRAMDYRPVLFDAVDEAGRPYYHTNVMLWIGSRCAAICLEAIAPDQRESVREALARTHAVIELDRRAVAHFAGNMIEVRGRAAAAEGEAGRVAGALQPCLLMSASAEAVLSPRQREQLAAYYGRWIVVQVPTIETVGGGSVRCMVAEVPS